MKTRRFICILFLGLGLTQNLSAQIFQDSVFHEKIWTGLDYMYNYNFKQADQAYRSVTNLYPDHPGPYCMIALNMWWQTLLSESTPYLNDRMLEVLDTAVLLGKNFHDQPAYDMEIAYCNFITYLTRSTVLASERKWLKAAGDARKSLPHLKLALAFTDNLPELYFISGMYHYWAFIIPEKYVLARPFMIFFPNGDKQKGIEELEVSGESPNYSQYESLFVLTNIYLNDIKEYKKGLRITKKLYQTYPKNLWFRSNYAHALLLNGCYDEAEKELMPMIRAFEQQDNWDSQNIDGKTSPYTTFFMVRVYHYMGKTQLLGKQNYQAALGCFQKGDFLSKLAQIDANELLAANTYLTGRCYDGLKLRDKAMAYYKMALKMDQNIFIKEEAKACLKTPCP